MPPTCQVAEGSTEVEGGGEDTVSLAGCEPKLAEIIEQISKNLDTVVDGLDEMSLAGFRGQLLEIMEKIGEKLVQTGPEIRPVTGRLNSSTIENDRTITPAAG